MEQVETSAEYVGEEEKAHKEEEEEGKVGWELSSVEEGV